MAAQLCMDRVIAPAALAALPEVMARHGFGKRIMLVCDDITYVAAGQAIYVALLPHYQLKPYSLGRHVHAKLNDAEALAAEAQGFDAMLAVGGGTVNDVTKYASAHLGIPYISVATAASMNGYSSATASLEAEGMKHSYPARPPVAVVADLDVIAAAPKKLARAGVGDMLCRSTTQLDCLLSHRLLGTPYPADDFAMLRQHEDYLVSHIGKLKENDHNYYAALMHALLDAGDAMARVGSSITASQGEHMIAHTLEMMYGSEVRLLHGELIAVTTITMAELQQKILIGSPAVKSLPREADSFGRIFGRRLGPHAATAYAPKVLRAEQADAINATLVREWTDLKHTMSEMMLKSSVLERAYIHANIACRPKDAGINPDRYNAAVTYAYLTRNRFTFLDLAAMMVKRA